MNNRRRMIVSAAACSRDRSTPGPPSSADGKCRMFCFLGITARSRSGGSSRAAIAPRKTGRIYSATICRAFVSDAVAFHRTALQFPEDYAGVDAAEAKRITHHVIQLGISPVVRDHVEMPS